MNKEKKQEKEILERFCTDGLLYEILDEEMKVVLDVTIEGLVADWQENT